MDGPHTAKKTGSVPDIPNAVVNLETKNKIKPNKTAPHAFVKCPPCLWLGDNVNIAAINTMARKYNTEDKTE